MIKKDNVSHKKERKKERKKEWMNERKKESIEKVGIKKETV